MPQRIYAKNKKWHHRPAGRRDLRRLRRRGFAPDL